MKIANNLTELIGNTPIVKLNKLKPKDANILLKLESFNPTNSIKDRTAYQMIKDGKAEGKIDSNTVIIEPTSGNTGIGLAMICAIEGLRLILTMPQTMSNERRMLLKAYGADLILTDGELGMKGAINKALELKAQYKNSFIPSQFDNPSNPKIHYKTTAEEIWKDTNKKVDIVVCGVGTGGTITGIGENLKRKNKHIQIVAVEPYSSPLLSSGKFGIHKIQGIGTNFIPKILNKNIIDIIMQITDEEAINTARLLSQKEGILTGFSGGASACAAIKLGQLPQNSYKNIVAIIPDYGERYLSTELYNY